jgi:sulfate adenylyltransferase large subunit
VALLGKPNVGKSSLLNKLAGESRVVVDSVAGTTVDPVDELIVLGDREWWFVDTAGIRRRVREASGHEYYASLRTHAALEKAEVAVMLIDAGEPISEQDLRIIHMIIESGRALVLAMNKMDLVGWDEAVFRRIEQEFRSFASKLDVQDITFIPMSALLGDNVVDRSANMPWYKGSSLLHHLENVHIASDRNLVDVRFPVQWVVRPQSQSQEHHDYRGYAGQLAGGVMKAGDEVVVLPSGFGSKIARIETFDGDVAEAFPPMSVTVHLADDLDVSRGDMLCRPNNRPFVGQELEAMVCWMGEQPLQVRGRYALKHTTKWAKAMVTGLSYRLDINTLHREEGVPQLKLNDIGRVSLRVSAPLAYDEYRRNRSTGSFILVDESTNNTVGAGMLLSEPR